ncbi:MAG: helix-turn-helix transcriptional regulator [bacterium]|nr:helix-turn-helix transcriptional regulator [bacterium]
MKENNPPRRPHDAATEPARTRRSSGAHALPELVGAMFRTAREIQGLSQEQVALRTDGLAELSRTTISDIERGKSLPTLPVLVSLSKALHIDPAEVLEQVSVETTTPFDVEGLGVETALAKAEALFWAGDYRAALSMFGSTLEILHRDESLEDNKSRRIRAKIEVNRATALRQISALRAATASARRAIEFSREFPDYQAEAYMVLASLDSHQGLLELAELHAEKSISLAENGNAKLRGKAWSQMANVLFRMDRFEQARHAFLEARKLALEAGDVRDQASTEGNVGACLAMLDQPEQALRRFVAAIDLARKCSDPAAEAFWLVALGRLAFERDSLDDADRYAALALEIARPSERVLTVFCAEWLRHLVVKRRDPTARDEKRTRQLTKLYSRVKEHRNLDVIREFEESILNARSTDE